MDKTELQIIAILGVLKAGQAYVPIDPNYPDQRIQFILLDTSAKTIVTNGHYVERISHLIENGNKVSIINMESLLFSNFQAYNPENICTPNNLAYLIYTSGSTGQPKGILIEHRNVINLYKSILSLHFGEERKQQEAILFFSNYTFGLSVEQMLLSIFSGQKLIIPTKNMLIGSDNFYNYLNANNLTYMSGTPSQMQLIDFSRLITLRILMVAGEKLLKSHFEHILRGFHGTLMNVYGSSEATHNNLAEKFTIDDKYTNCFGTQLAGGRFYILDDNQRLVPIGAIGELCISGMCVTRGYLNRREKTAENFIRNPFQKENEKTNGMFEKLYKTGDSARWMHDNKIEILGRNDGQVSIIEIFKETLT